MSEFIRHIHYSLGFKIRKPNGLSRHSEEEKSGIDVYLFDVGQLLNLENDDARKEEDTEDVKLKRIDILICEEKNRQWVVLQEHRLEVLR